MPSRVPPDLPAPAPELATLRVIVLPWGDVEVDGVKRGTTPRLRTLQVPAGKHVVVISHPELGKRTHEVSLDDPEHETVLEVDLSHP